MGEEVADGRALGPGRLVQVDRPSSYATSTAYAASGLVTEASGKRRPVGPWAPARVPSARTTAAAAVGTGQSSIDARLGRPFSTLFSTGLSMTPSLLALPERACFECAPTP